MKRPLLFLLLASLSLPLCAQDADPRGLKMAVSQLEGEKAVIGKQYAVLIAIDKYKNWTALRNPVKDAKEVKEILARRYFVTDFIELYDEAATKAGIMKLFGQLIHDTKPEDSLMLFYAGHGHMDTTSNTGFWIPVDGGMDVYDQSNWLPNTQIRGFIGNIKARHISLIVDSCFSGDFLNQTRGVTPTIANEYFKNAYTRVSRQVLTSGASESVPDESSFCRQLKLALEGNTSPYLDPLMLYNQIRLGVTHTTPLFGDLKESGHQEGSSFLLFLKTGAIQAAKGAISLEHPIEVAPELEDGELSDQDPLPVASIAIDGRFDDWKDIPPAFAHSQPETKKENLIIDKVSLALDSENLYMRFDIRDRTPVSTSHSHNFGYTYDSYYGIRLKNGTAEIILQVFHEVPAAQHQLGEWECGIARSVRRKVAGLSFPVESLFRYAKGSFAMQCSSLEAAFPLKKISECLQLDRTSRSYSFTAFIEYTEPPARFLRATFDRTRSKYFTF